MFEEQRGFGRINEDESGVKMRGVSLYCRQRNFEFATREKLLLVEG